ncbi:MAG: 4a-hydroxytetrahydrobiopterin dehydratase [Solirubrobacteraceae bacterium]|nr:4a-hydroxytetrahydrobiopterin dehydratase [Solirubrobacteraceae bacterium]
MSRSPERDPQPVPLKASDIDQALAEHPGWRRVGKTLVRDLSMRDFDEALRLVERVGQLAVDYLRRPDMCISEFNRVRLRIVNVHHAGLTQAELRLAAKTSAVVDEHDEAERALPSRAA